MIIRLILFLILNFGALAIGSIFTNEGVTSEWYQSLAKAPWNPPGWMFGAAWTTIMICFAFYMAYAWNAVSNKKALGVLFGIQWVLNIAWNPIFFHFREVLLALITITALTFLLGYLMFRYGPVLKLKSILLLPYLIWLLIATSLNGYIWMNN